MTRAEYAQYETSVSQFMKDEGIVHLTIDGEPYFSSRRCDCCKTMLSGDRYPMSGYNPKSREKFYYDYVCNDCLYYVTYGQLDDMTMANMTD